jgi:hypothetical protein
MQQEQLLMGEWLDSLMFEQWGGKALALDIGGKPHTFATDGHGLTLVAGAGLNAASDAHASNVKRLLCIDSTPGRRAFSMPLTELRAWLPADPNEISCPACNGGQLKEFKCATCRGDGVVECGSCGHEKECHECGGAKKSLVCYQCEGDGKLPAPRSVASIVPGVVIDQRVLQRFLGPLLRDEQVKVSVGGPLDAAFFHGSDWTVIVMPFKHDPEKTTLGRPLREAP